ncbi:MAG: dimethylsulfonioproprionate lyase family protein [Halanaerobium sp.]
MLKTILEELSSIYSKKLLFVKSNSPQNDLTMLKHLDFVAEELDKLKDEFKIVEIKAETKPVVSYLSQISSDNRADDYKMIIKNLKELKGELLWRYGYQNPSQAMLEKYAYTEVVGPEGPIYSEELIIGFVLLAPDFYYPKHKHTQIEESYLFLTDKTIYNKSILTAGSFILNECGEIHEIKSAAEKATLILYSWIKKGEGSLKDYQLNLE